MHDHLHTFIIHKNNAKPWEKGISASGARQHTCIQFQAAHGRPTHIFARHGHASARGSKTVRNAFAVQCVLCAHTHTHTHTHTGHNDLVHMPTEQAGSAGNKCCRQEHLSGHRNESTCMSKSTIDHPFRNSSISPAMYGARPAKAGGRGPKVAMCFQKAWQRHIPKWRAPPLRRTLSIQSNSNYFLKRSPTDS